MREHGPISGLSTASVCIVPLVLYFVGAGLNWHQPVLSCIWNTCLITTVFCGVHVAAGIYVSSPTVAWSLLSFLLLALPFATEDRLPFPVQPRGCPSWLHYSWGGLTIILAIV